MTLDVLLIDDDSIDRDYIRRCLIRRGRSLRVREAGTADEGLSCLRDSAFDCILLDYMLPDRDGISFLREIYSPETDLGPCPVIILTGQGRERTMADALRWGAQDYLIKDNISNDTLDIAMVKAREIYELKKSRFMAEEQLRQAQKMEAIGQLTSGVAHDFNNLLTVILGNTRLIRKRIGGDAEWDKDDLLRKIGDVDTAARRGADLVRRLMIFTRQKKLDQEVVDVGECVKNTFDLVKSSLGPAIAVRFSIPDGIWPVSIDPGQFSNALINMAVNARHAMPDGGKMTVEIQNIVLDDEYALRHPEVAVGLYVMIAISDTGHGMSPEIRRRIFEPFFTTKPAGEGTGLGLSMVYGLMRQSGGHINVYSEEGHGTVFRMYLPRVGTAAEEAFKEAPKEPLPGGVETILLVEDDDDVRSVAETMLAKLGYRPILAHNANMALEILRREHDRIDMIFTDIVMPGGMNGAQLAQQAKEFYPDIKILYTSGYTENAIPDYQLVDGQDIISKPYRREALAKKIRSVLDAGKGEGAQA